MALDPAAFAIDLIAACGITDTAGKAAMTNMATVIDAYIKSATVTIAVGSQATGVMTGAGVAPIVGTAMIT